MTTANQQSLAAIKFGISRKKVIWRLLNLASPPSMQCTINVIYICWRDKYWENTQFAKYNSTPKFVDLQYMQPGYAITRLTTHFMCGLMSDMIQNT